MSSVEDPLSSARYDYRADHTRAVPRLPQVTLTTVPGRAVIVHIEGEVDQDTRRTLEDALARAIGNRPPRLVVDLAGLSFCYSVCLNTLLAARLDAKAVGVQMVLAAATPQTVRLLEITGADEIFTVRGSVREALADGADRPMGEVIAMDIPSRYAVTLPGVPGRHGPPEVVVVRATGEVTMQGEPVYADEAGTFRVEITGEVARPLAEPAGPGRHTCLHAVPLP
ncbi:DUF6296 family protein [Kitasatospora sp. KL5]|uniref:DUF6296 family protein n=1 Tax=Kitasatospora sp. KL5 TaxID=3425125 RepID=UPI003D6F8284